jgi:hypothetical protein
MDQLECGRKKWLAILKTELDQLGMGNIWNKGQENDNKVWEMTSKR